MSGTNALNLGKVENGPDVERGASASFNKTVQRTGANRIAQRQIERQEWLAPVAYLGVRATCDACNRSLKKVKLLHAQ
jgi:hypothetical protein